jgi:hypothetical protein
MRIKQDVSALHKVESKDPSTGPGAYGLGLASVVRVDYARHEVVLRVMSGERDYFEWTSVSTTASAAGARHFIGALPEPGDICVVGWLTADTRIPIILTWLPMAAGSGYEWLPIQPFLPTEVDMNPKTLSHFEGIYGRSRHKMPAMRPGGIYLSSSQGSDIHLDEGVLITNRRANEIYLRDQDQAIVFRSLQQFHAMGGARIYAGMVQRDATFLPRRMFSDGTYWNAPVQVDDNGDPLTPEQLGASPVAKTALTPHAVFVRSDVTLPFPDSGIILQDNVDPYSFLQRGLFIGSDGYALDPSSVGSDAEYGGKPVFRVSIDPNPENTALPNNGMIGEETAESDTLTEYRIEINHTWDGRLPVTEQTDGLDADRLPSDSVQANAMSNAGPFIEWVLGSVVGNDPYTRQGRELYGLPLVPVIFDGDRTAPRLESGIGVPLEQHGATLFRLISPVQDPSRVPPMFISTTKDGSVKGFLGGAQTDNSLELALNGGMRVQANGPMIFDAPNMVLNFRNADPTNNYAAAITSDTGAILIRGNAPTTEGSFSARAPSTDLQENKLPSVLVESPNGSVHVRAGRETKISGANAVQVTDTNEFLVVSKQNVNTFTDKWLLQCNTVDKTVQGRETNLYSGPKNFLPSNAPLRETKFIATPLTGHAGGKTDEYTMLFGDRVENFRVGDHTTTILIGNATWRTTVGTVTLRAGLNQIAVSTSSGIRATCPTGTIAITSTLATSVTALASLTLKSAGQAKLSGTIVTLGGSGKVGRILSSADRDPLTNLPYSFFGLGSFGHRLGIPI